MKTVREETVRLLILMGYDENKATWLAKNERNRSASEGDNSDARIAKAQALANLEAERHG